MNRRRFIREMTRTIISVGVSILGFGMLSRYMKRHPAPLRLETEPTTIRPPGALAEKDFLTTCIRCQRCQDACPTGAILLAGPNDQVQLGTPFILPSRTACNLCLECTQTCPTGALRPLVQKTEVTMGVAVVDKRTCVSHNGSGVCGACHTACPLRNSAITQGLRNAPTVHEDYCVGCGLCEDACILKGTKAIRVFSGRQPV